MMVGKRFYRLTHTHSAVYDVETCPSVCSSHARM